MWQLHNVSARLVQTSFPGLLLRIVYISVYQETFSLESGRMERSHGHFAAHTCLLPIIQSNAKLSAASRESEDKN